MKKTILAMAVASVVAAPAMADVSISGKVEQLFTSTDSTTASSDQLQGATDAALNFKASEDLGNGMSAFATTRLDADGASGAISTLDTTVGITGGFGTVVAGRMEAFSEAKIMSMVDVLGGTSVEPEQDSAARADDAIAYVSPAMNGLTVGVAGYSVVNTSVTDDDAFDIQELALMYANGPLAVNVSKTDANASAQSALGVGDASSVGIKYTAGDLAVSGVWQDIDDESSTVGNDNTNYALAAVYTMGSNSVALGYVENEGQDGTTDNNTTALELRHNFSGRTRAYAGATWDDNATSSTETDTVFFGLEHSF